MTDEQPTEQFTARLDTVPLPAPAPTRPRKPRKPFPVWPAIVAALGVALLVVSVALVVTLTHPNGPAPTPPGRATSTPAPSAAPPAPAAPPAVRPEPGPNECVDELADAGSVDLDTVTLDEHDGDLIVRFLLAGALPAGESGVGLVVQSRNGRAAYQVSIGFTSGVLDRFLVWDGDDERNLDLDRVRVEGPTITATVSGGDLSRLGNNWNWSAFGTAAVSELDACPGNADDREWLRFEGKLDD